MGWFGCIVGVLEVDKVCNVTGDSRFSSAGGIGEVEVTMGSPDDREVEIMLGTSAERAVRLCDVDYVSIGEGTLSRSGDMMGEIDEEVISVGKGVALFGAVDVIDEIGFGVGSPNGHSLGFMVGGPVGGILSHCLEGPGKYSGGHLTEEQNAVHITPVCASDVIIVLPVRIGS